MNSINNKNSKLIAKIFEVISKLSKDGIFPDGEYRVVTNCGEKAGQTIKHLHFHVLSGRGMHWPPG